MCVCVCLLVFRKQFCKGLAQFLHCLLLQTIVKGLQDHSLSLILVHCHRRPLECLPTGLHHLRYLDIIERLFAVFHIKKIDPVLKTAILVSDWPTHLLIIARHFQPITFHKRRFSILIGPFFIDSCQSNDVTGDLHKIWTNHRPFQVLRHTTLLLVWKEEGLHGLPWFI